LFEKPFYPCGAPMYCLLQKSGCIWYVPVWGRFLKWETSTCRLSTWVYIYIYIHLFIGYQINQRTHFDTWPWFSQKSLELKNWPKKSISSLLVLSWKPLILWGFSNNHDQQFFDSTILKELELAIFFSKNSRNCPTLGMYYVSSIGHPFLVIFPKYFWGTKILLY